MKCGMMGKSDNISVMFRGARTFIVDSLGDIPYLVKSEHTNRNKWKLFLTYIRISLKLFTVNRWVKITEEELLGFRVVFFDYGTLHFLYREIFMRGGYLFQTDNEQPRIFDCGANIGLATIFFKWIYPQATVHAFEPDPTTYAMLVKNIRRNNLSNTYAHNLAVSNHNGHIGFYVDKNNPGWLTMSLSKDRFPKDKINVKRARLSGFINNNSIDLIKMDIEGAEKQVILELDKSKKFRFVKELIMEYHHEINKDRHIMAKLFSTLENNGFVLQLGASPNFPIRQQSFQDIQVHAYKKVDSYD